jgi:hypothetical protein
VINHGDEVFKAYPFDAKRKRPAVLRLARGILKQGEIQLAFTATRLVNQGAIQDAVRAVEKEFSPQVVRIVHSFGEDHAGFPAIYFRILVRDEDAPVARLHDVARRLSIALMNRAKTDENSLNAYFNYRSVSEQEKLRDPDWD